MPASVEKLERQFGAWLGTPHAVATGSGRGALCLALATLDAGPGEVLLPEFVCSQAPEAVRRAGHRPVFFPVREDLTCLPSDAIRAITSQTRGVVLVHYYGVVQPQTQEIAAVCRARAIPLIEDCALALGATDGRGIPAGRAGDAAIFSLTKSAWCYGGGLAVTASEKWAARMRSVRTRMFCEAPGLLAAYGCLRRADFAANRPAWSALGERIGPFLEKILSGLWNSGEGKSSYPRRLSFYDALPFDVRMSSRCVGRARRLLARFPETRAVHRQFQREFSERLQSSGPVVLRPDQAPGDSGAFLVLRSPAGRAMEWRETAGRADVTLRLTWPAFQSPEPGHQASRQDWFARHLLVLEIHERLTAREISKITSVISSLAEMDSKHADA